MTAANPVAGTGRQVLPDAVAHQTVHVIETVVRHRAAPESVIPGEIPGDYHRRERAAPTGGVARMAGDSHGGHGGGIGSDWLKVAGAVFIIALVIIGVVSFFDRRGSGNQRVAGDPPPASTGGCTIKYNAATGGAPNWDISNC